MDWVHEEELSLHDSLSASLDAVLAYLTNVGVSPLPISLCLLGLVYSMH